MTSRRRNFLGAEPLERRLLLTAAVGLDLESGVLTIDGTHLNDAAYVRSAGHTISVSVSALGETTLHSFEKSDVTQIVFWGRLGNDSFRNGTDIPTEAHGGNGADRLSGGSGPDDIWGDGGADGIVGGLGNDRLHGGQGADNIRGGLGDDQVNGNSGDDLLNGNEGNDRVSGGSGDDDMYGSLGTDLLRGGAGNDIIYGGGEQDEVYGNDGNDRLYGDAADDLIIGGRGRDYLHGGDGADKLYGGDERDELRGGEGKDRLYGESSHDTLFGNEGNDVLDGGSSNDEMFGGAGDDRLIAGTGHDLVMGGDGEDSILGGRQRDLIVGGNGRDRIQGGQNDDLLIGGTTIYDADIEKLREIHQIWRTGNDYNGRVTELGRDPEIRLAVERTVIDDEVRDMVNGDGGEDWFFLTGQWNQTSGRSLADFLNGLDTITGPAEGERLETAIAHADQGRVHMTEHHAMLDLVNYQNVTHTAVKSGEWSDRSTWGNGIVPSDGANVLIPFGLNITVDDVIPARLRTVRVDGVLQFDPTQTTELALDTLVATPGSSLLMGTANDPIDADVTARLLIIDDFGSIDRVWDPFAFSRGVIAHGEARFYGAEKTPFVTLERPARRGSKQLVLESEPANWRPGDRLVLAGTQHNQHEELEIASVDGKVVRLTRNLRFYHEAPNERMSIHVANLTRNAMIDSESNFTHRGHLMFMHTRDVAVNYLGIHNLGRTNKRIPLDDARVNRNLELREGTGENQRGRYALHFHRNGVHADHDRHDGGHAEVNSAAKVHGSVVNDSAGWGYVNHSSYVDFTSNIAYDTDGSGFVTEAGDEIGSFVGNLAIRSRGSRDGIESRRNVQDFGHQGDGFWFQGGGVRVVDNVAVGQSGHGFVFFTRGLEQDLGTTRFPAENLVHPEFANGNDTVQVGEVPLLEFRNNEAYANGIGMATRFHMLRDTHQEVSVIEDLRLWNNDRGMHIPYTNRTILRDLEVIGNKDRPSGIGISRNNVTRNITFENISVEGFRYGVQVPTRGENVLVSGRLNNIENVVVTTPVQSNRIVRILSGMQLQTPANLRGYIHYDVVLQANFAPHGGSVRHVFGADTILWESPRGDLQLYFAEQASSYIPFPEPDEDVLSSYVGKTNQELRDQYRKSVGGELLPDDAFKVREVRGYAYRI